MKVCKKCGHNATSIAKYCGICGDGLPDNITGKIAYLKEEKALFKIEMYMGDFLNLEDTGALPSCPEKYPQVNISGNHNVINQHIVDSESEVCYFCKNNAATHCVDCRKPLCEGHIHTFWSKGRCDNCHRVYAKRVTSKGIIHTVNGPLNLMKWFGYGTLPSSKESPKPKPSPPEPSLVVFDEHVDDLPENFSDFDDIPLVQEFQPNTSNNDDNNLLPDNENIEATPVVTSPVVEVPVTVQSSEGSRPTIFQKFEKIVKYFKRKDRLEVHIEVCKQLIFDCKEFGVKEMEISLDNGISKKIGGSLFGASIERSAENKYQTTLKISF